MKILVLDRNPSDSLGRAVLPALQRRFPAIEFKKLNSLEFIEEEGRELIIIGPATGLESVTLIDDLDDLHVNKVCCNSGFDLPLTMRVMQKMKLIDSARIIAVPSDCSNAQAIQETATVISELLKS